VDLRVSAAHGDLAPSLHWAEPMVAIADPERRGPVLTTIEYQVDPARAEHSARAADLRRGAAAQRRLRWAVRGRGDADAT
jgi:hypothetical protein